MMDDWIFVRAALTLATQGAVVLPGVTQMVALGHVLVGAGVVTLLGFSFETLRIIMLIAGWAGLVALYAASRTFGASPAIAALAAGTLLVNPVYLTLSATFMTDIPFFLCSTLALLAFGRALRSAQWSDIVMATLFCMAGVSIRQTGLILPLAFVAGHLVAHPFRGRVLAQALFPISVVALELVTLQTWMAAAAILPRDYNLPMRTMLAHLRAPTTEWVVDCLKRGLNIGFHIGWFVLPFVIAVGAWSRRQGRAWAGAAAALFVAILLTGKVAPWGSSLLYDFGMGGVSLYDVTRLGLPHLPRAPWGFWLALTLLSGTALIALALQWLTAFWQAWRPSQDGTARFRRATVVLAVLTVAGYVGPMMLSWFYDRYLLPIIPCLLLYPVQAATGTVTTWRRNAAIAALLPFAFFVVATGHDYFAWNRARWQGSEFLLLRAEPTQIDAGYEFAGWQRYAEDAEWRAPAVRRYLITFGPVPGYRRLAQFEYSTWLPPRRSAILVLEKQ